MAALLVATNDFVVVPTVPGRRYYYGLGSASWGTATAIVDGTLEDSNITLATKTANGFGEFIALSKTTRFVLTSGTPDEPIEIVCGEIIQR